MQARINCVTLYDMKNAITIRLDDELNDLLNFVAKQQRRKRSEIIRESLRRQLLLQRFESLREWSLQYGEKNKLLTDEDVFKEIS
ncbi:MAG: ribbon-helix-helix protein, CopG family [Calditrichaceae bacterium]|nr:ribbon-helix-helix protein, CopG family [Calditrichaceae bacterium]